MKVGRGDEVRHAEAELIDRLGLPGIALMELAARGVADAVRDHHLDEARAGVLVVTGAGNNGGDGWAVARWLHAWGLPVTVWPVSEPRPGSDAATMAGVTRRLGVREVDHIEAPGLIVDAVFGIGLDRPVEGRYRDVLTRLDAHAAPVVAVDIPSGLCADRGVVLGCAIRAARTVTFGVPKRGFYGPEGPSRVGAVQVVDLGLQVADVEAEVPERAALARSWPLREAGAHKGSSGHLLVVAGSRPMAGAAELVCRGALRAGAGLVTLCSPRGALARLGNLPAEVMWLEGGPADVLQELDDLGGQGTAVAAGPGLGGGQPLPESLARGLAALWTDDARPVVYDADALPCTSERPAGARVLTPHPGEAARLLGTDVPAVQGDRFAAASALQTRGTVVLKGPHSLVASRAHPLSINPSGAAVLATAGSGDVLTGVVGALLARGATARDAARCGAYVHGLAGEILRARRSDGWTASDIAAALPEAIARLTTGPELP